MSDLLPHERLTKRVLTSDIARTFDVLGWFSPVVVMAKILLQRLWEERVQWDDPVPEELEATWSKWRSELSLLTEWHIARCYFPKNVMIAYQQLHGFADASERAYAGVVLPLSSGHDGQHPHIVGDSKNKINQEVIDSCYIIVNSSLDSLQEMYLHGQTVLLY